MNFERKKGLNKIWLNKGKQQLLIQEQLSVRERRTVLSRQETKQKFTFVRGISGATKTGVMFNFFFKSLLKSKCNSLSTDSPQKTKQKKNF